MASYSFKVSGIEPRYDPDYRIAGDSAKKAFWNAAVAIILEVKDKELRAGKDRFGDDLTPIKESTRKRGRWRSHTGLGTPGNPPLDPAQSRSRTRDLLAGRSHWKEGYALFFWRFDTVSGRQWGQILGYHREGAGYLPVRDVIGISPESLKEVKRRVLAWWRDHKSGKMAYQYAGKFGEEPESAPAKIVATGLTDLTHVVFGSPEEAARSKAAIEAGYATGFRQLPPKRFSAPRVVAEPKSPIAPRAAAKPKITPKPKPEVKEPVAKEPDKKAITRDEIKEIQEGNLSPKEKVVKISDLIKKNQSPDKISIQMHGMSHPEEMHHVEFEGIRFYFPPLTNGTGVHPETYFVDPVITQIKSLSEANVIDKRISGYTKEIYFTKQANKQDAFWEKEYKIKGFSSAATGGDGAIVVYDGNSLKPGSVAHEMGHNFAQGVYGSYDPPIGSQYRKAIESGEKPVSDYAKVSNSEDFAEAIKIYVFEKDKMKEIAPIRYAAIKNLIEKHQDAGTTPRKAGGEPVAAPTLPDSGSARRESVSRARDFASNKEVRFVGNGSLETSRRFGDKASKINAFYTPKSQAVVINETQAYWDHPEEYMAEKNRTNWYSSPNRDHIIHHEVGHALHHKVIGDAGWEKISSMQFNAEQIALITETVSRYAASSPIEFIAEVYAAKLHGIVIEPRIERLYSKLKGPTT